MTPSINDKDVLLDDLDSDMMMAYEAYLKNNGVSPNSSSFYMRNLRAVYNRAVEKELTSQRFPFKHVYTGVDKTVKRAVPLKVIKRIKEMDFSMNPTFDFARDMFLMSFYTRGMSFVDMAYLRKKDLQNGVLSYRRRKTGQQLFVKWEKLIRNISRAKSKVGFIEKSISLIRLITLRGTPRFMVLSTPV